MATSVRGGRNWTGRGSLSVKGLMDSARVKDPCRCCCQALVLSIGLLTQGAAVGQRSGILKVIGLAGRYGHRGCGQFVDGCGAGCCEAPL